MINTKHGAKDSHPATRDESPAAGHSRRGRWRLSERVSPIPMDAQRKDRAIMILYVKDFYLEYYAMSRRWLMLL